MKKINTDLLLFILVIALIVFTYLGILDRDDFNSFLLSFASYKFGRSQGVDKPIVNP